jgi:DNA-binding YbaB/EbfC family protein
LTSLVPRVEDVQIGEPMPDFTKMLKQAQKLQSQIKEMQEELGRREVEASSGGGMVMAKVSGKKELISLKIDPQVAGEDMEMLEDLIVAAVNEAQRRVDEMIKEEMSKMTGGLPIPGLF